jgi:hypothetical protein
LAPTGCAFGRVIHPDRVNSRIVDFIHGDLWENEVQYQQIAEFVDFGINFRILNAERIPGRVKRPRELRFGAPQGVTADPGFRPALTAP